MVIERQRGLPEIPSLSPEKERMSRETLLADVLVIGGGPAGLAAAIKAAQFGLNIIIVEDHYKLGGQLIKQTHRFFGSRELFGGLRGFQIAQILERQVKEYGNVRVLTKTYAYGVFRDQWVGLISENSVYEAKAKCYILATGAMENYLAFPGNDLPGVIGAGGAQTLMNEYGIRPGKKALIVGAGNVGLIVAYQLLQAGVRVKAVLEIMPQIGGWFVHAAKIARYGVPILLQHTIKEVLGKDSVEAAIIVKVDKDYSPIPGTERKIECDFVLLSAGLTPDTRLLSQFGVKLKWVPELGGLVPLRTKYLETTIPNVLVAGDMSGIEEATTAIIEGWIAGLTAVVKVLGPKSEVLRERERLLKLLKEYRAAPVSERVKRGLKRVII
ncbi:MAG: sarcosine oxidase subunit alpha [Thermoprotei archaeon]|nr:MAG: sarcosine oxidase subunit alpha [Thermoprotei archaeon]